MDIGRCRTPSWDSCCELTFVSIAVKGMHIMQWDCRDAPLRGELISGVKMDEQLVARGVRQNRTLTSQQRYGNICIAPEYSPNNTYFNKLLQKAIKTVTVT
eukprot:3674911-Amphidinium_carterae.1